MKEKMLAANLKVSNAKLEISLAILSMQYQ